MKIISTVQATKNNVTADRGSMSTPMEKILSPRANHPTEEAMGVSPRCSTPMAAKKTIMPISQESAAAPTPTQWLMLLLRRVNSKIRKNASKGGSGISQVRLAVDIIELPLHQIDLVRGHGLAAAINGDHQGQTHSYFGSGYGEYHYSERLPGNIFRSQVAPKCHKVDVDCVQHQLYAHQNGNGILTCQHTVQTHAEQGCS